MRKGKIFLYLSVVVVFAIICLISGIRSLEIKNARRISLSDLEFVGNHFPPFTYKGAEGNVDGFMIDLLRLVWNDLDVSQDPRVVLIPPTEDSYKSFAQNPSIVFLNLLKNEKNKDDFTWVCTRGHKEKIYIFGLKQSEVTPYEKTSPIKYVILDTYVFSYHLEPLQIPESQITVVNKIQDVGQMLKNGDVHLSVAPIRHFLWHWQEDLGYSSEEIQTHQIVDNMPACFAFHTSIPSDTVEHFAKALKKAEQSKHYTQLLSQLEPLD